MLRLVHVTAALSAAVLPSAAHACTVCDSAGGRQLRAGLFDGHTLHTSLLVAAPIPVFLFALVLLYLSVPDFEQDAAAGRDRDLAASLAPEFSA